jgi:poly-gamma-glutamate capsule biosynthesis protein CapA/YwtB (metallophosphatase superfamily)
MKKDAVIFLGVGDVAMSRERPETIFQHVLEVLRSGDVTFANSEQPHSKKGHPNPERAAYSNPRNIPALLHANFDVVSLANNHIKDWGAEALLDTMTRLKKAGLPYVGVGRNIAEAHQPVILERKGTKIGFLAYSCVGPNGYEAEEDKPGYAPIKVWTIYEVVDHDPASIPRIVSFPYREDLALMVEDIQKLKRRADIVVVSFHWGTLLVPHVIPMYCVEIGHAAIDAGADLILGTHPHILKGIEVYKGKVIFYSTSNFAMDNRQRSASPDRKFVMKLEKHYGAWQDAKHREKRRKSLIVKVIIEDREIKKVSYLPCYINEQSEPEIVTRSDPRGRGVFKYIQDISRSENLPVHFFWEGDEAVIQP